MNRIDRVVSRFKCDAFGYFSVVAIFLIVPPLVTTVAVAAFVGWVDYTAPVSMAACLTAWLFGEWNIKRKEREKVETLLQAVNYIFEVSSHLGELDKKGHLFSSNDRFELYVREKTGV